MSFDNNIKNTRSRFLKNIFYQFKIYINYCILVSILILFQNVQSQTDNYWSWSFNTPSMLVAGSVVGGSAGPSAIFYNPSIINHESMPSLTVSANILSLQDLKADNIAGTDLNADKLFFKIQPRFVSYVLPNKNEKVGMTVAILSPVSEEVNYSINHNDELDIIKRTEGLEEYSGFLRYSRKYDDIYIGFGMSYEISDRFFVGASSFVSVKLLKYDYEQSALANQQKDSVSVGGKLEPKYISESSFEELMKYWDLSLVFKLGAIYKAKTDRLSIGGNITFPNIPVFGHADVRKSYTNSNIYNNVADVFTSNDFFDGNEIKQRTTIKSPFSSAIGMQYSTKKMKNAISITLEYFHKIDSYSLYEISDKEMEGFSDVDMNYKDFMSYYTKAKSVVNFGIGFKQFVSESLTISGGFRTDFTPGENSEIRFSQNRFKINQIHLDKYHITAGTILAIKSFKVVSGLQYTYARANNLEQLVNYADPVEYNPVTREALVGTRENNVSVKYNELSFFMGVIVDLKKKNLQDNLTWRFYKS